jgi:hypothetical protein
VALRIGHEGDIARNILEEVPNGKHETSSPAGTGRPESNGFSAAA